MRKERERKREGKEEPLLSSSKKIERKREGEKERGEKEKERRSPEN